MDLNSVFLGDLICRSGWAPESARDRQIEDGSQFDKYFTQPKLKKDLKRRNGSVGDTVKLMKVIIKTKSQQVGKLAREVLAITDADGKLNIYKTVENIFNFIFKYIKYNIEDGEQLQSPRHTWWRAQVLARQNNKKENSADCDCFSIFAGSCMYQLGIPFSLKIAGYNQDTYQHVYVVAYDNGTPIICDPVTNNFNYEKPPVISRLFPMQPKKMALHGTDIYVLDGTETNDLPVGISYKEDPDGNMIVTGGLDLLHGIQMGALGKSKKKAEKKAAKKQAKAEKKAAKKQAKIEKKAAKREAKAEKKAEKKIKKAEKKAAKLEKKAEKKGGKKAEKLLKKAEAVREKGQIKADAIKEKAKEKTENKLKKVDEKLKKKTAKIEVKRLKQSGASKEEIKAAKQHLKDVKKEIRKARKEDGRGFIRKVGKGMKAAAMLPVRAAFLMLMNINFRGLATRLYNNPEAYEKFLKKWKNIFGGKEAKLKIAITKGQVHKPLFGSKKTNASIEVQTPEVQEDVEGFLGSLGVEPTTTAAAAAITAASSALAALTQILKDFGVNVPESVEDAIAAGEDVAELFPDQEVSEDPENWENPDEYDADTDGDGVISKKEARKAKKAAKKAAKAEKKAAKKAAKAEKKAARAGEDSDDDDENDENMANGKFMNFLKNAGSKVTEVVSTVTNMQNQELPTPQVAQSTTSNAAYPTQQVAQSTIPATTATATKEGMSTGAKVAIGLGALALVGGIIYLATGKNDGMQGYKAIELG